MKTWEDGGMFQNISVFFIVELVGTVAFACSGAMVAIEKQLDLLFQGDAMDITTDVEVLERMLAKDGLSDRESLCWELLQLWAEE